MDGSRLRAAREAAKKTQTQLAELLSVTQNSIWRWEKNMSEPDDKKKKELANVLNVTVAYLMGETEPAPDTKLLCLLYITFYYFLIQNTRKSCLYQASSGYFILLFPALKS